MLNLFKFSFTKYIKIEIFTPMSFLFIVYIGVFCKSLMINEAILFVHIIYKNRYDITIIHRVIFDNMKVRVNFINLISTSFVKNTIIFLILLNMCTRYLIFIIFIL